MKKPLYQKNLEISVWIISGVILICTAFNEISSAIKLIDFKIALFSTILFLMSFVLLQYFLKKKKVKWLTADKKLITFTSLSSKMKILLFTAIIFLWIPVMSSLFEKHSQLQQLGNRHPLFDSTDNRFKVLILPFGKECSYEGTVYDVGNLINKRLQELNRKDSINLVSRYLTDSINLNNFSPENADSMMNFNNADQILYGFYSLKECEGGAFDKICFNYRTNRKKWNLSKRQSKTNYEMIDISGLNAIRNGTGQEDIDYVIYYVSGISAEREGHFKKAIATFQKIKKYKQNIEILAQISDCFSNLDDYLNAEKWAKIGLKINTNNEIMLRTLGSIYSDMDNYKMSEKYFIKALNVDSESIQTRIGIGRLYFNSKIFNKALANFEIALEIDSNNCQALDGLARVYGKKGDYDRAKNLEEKALEIDSNYIDAWHILGSVYIGLKQYDSAEKALQKTISFNTQNEDPYSDLGNFISIALFRNVVL